MESVMEKRYGFIYLWFDKKHKKYYLGSHLGSKDDGYIGSNKRLICAYKSRPETFKRRILYEDYFENSRHLLSVEQNWLSLIKDEELFIKYYNEKKVAAGGDIVSTLPSDRKETHRTKSIKARQRGHQQWLKNQTPEELSKRGKYARSKVINPRNGALYGSDNPFYGKKHSEETKKKMSEKAKDRVGSRIKKYVIFFADGTQETHTGIRSIHEKYCVTYPLKFSRFIDTDETITTNRKSGRNNKLIDAKIITVGI